MMPNGLGKTQEDTRGLNQIYNGVVSPGSIIGGR
jgi:hypothetical protein